MGSQKRVWLLAWCFPCGPPSSSCTQVMGMMLGYGPMQHTQPIAHCHPATQVHLNTPCGTSQPPSLPVPPSEVHAWVTCHTPGSLPPCTQWQDQLWAGNLKAHHSPPPPTIKEKEQTNNFLPSGNGVQRTHLSTAVPGAGGLRPCLVYTTAPSSWSVHCHRAPP